MTANDRKRLRRTFRSRRRALSPREQCDHALAVSRHFFSSGLALRARTIGLYMANDGELDLTPLIARLDAAGKRLALPVIRSAPGRASVLEFYRYERDRPLVTNRYGIAEPAPGARYLPLPQIDLLLMPLVAFDRHGTRLGMGAGYYDRLLAGTGPTLRPLLVGVAHEVQRSTTPLPAADWDVPLDGVLTERGWHALPD